MTCCVLALGLKRCPKPTSWSLSPSVVTRKGNGRKILLPCARCQEKCDFAARLIGRTYFR